MKVQPRRLIIISLITNPMDSKEMKLLHEINIYESFSIQP